MGLHVPPTNINKCRFHVYFGMNPRVFIVTHIPTSSSTSFVSRFTEHIPARCLSPQVSSCLASAFAMEILQFCIKPLIYLYSKRWRSMLYFRVSHGQVILDQLILNSKLFNRSAKTNTIFDCNVSYRYHQCENMLTNGWHSQLLQHQVPRSSQWRGICIAAINTGNMQTVVILFQTAPAAVCRAGLQTGLQTGHGPVMLMPVLPIGWQWVKSYNPRPQRRKLKLAQGYPWERVSQKADIPVCFKLSDPIWALYSKPLFMIIYMQTLSSLLCTLINGMVSWKFRTDPLCFHSNTSPASSSTSFVLRFTCSLNTSLHVAVCSIFSQGGHTSHSASHMRHLTAQVTLLFKARTYFTYKNMPNSQYTKVVAASATDAEMNWNDKGIPDREDWMMIKPSKTGDLLIISLAPVGSAFDFQMQYKILSNHWK